LGLTFGDSEAVQLAEEALHEQGTNVRAAAAKALGAMSSLNRSHYSGTPCPDKDISVCLAVAHSLILLKENSGYDLYYDVLVASAKEERA